MTTRRQYSKTTFIGGLSALAIVALMWGGKPVVADAVVKGKSSATKAELKSNAVSTTMPVMIVGGIKLWKKLYNDTKGEGNNEK